MSDKIKKVKLKGNESFNIREGWLRKGMRLVNDYENLFSRNDVMELLGVGSKMVKSIRYWLQATGLCEETLSQNNRARVQHITKDFGEVIFSNDPYFDDIFTLSLLHYNIVSNDDLCIAWNIFFNEFDGIDFTKEDMVNLCKEKLQKKLDENVVFSDNSFEDDCSSILRMYINNIGIDDPEERLSCPLAELGLLQRSATIRNAYNKVPPSRKNLDYLAVLYVIVRNLKSGKNSVSIDELVISPNNIGRVFNLNRVLINDYLDQLRINGYLTINRTAGLNIVYIKNNISPKDIMYKYYGHSLVR